MSDNLPQKAPSSSTPPSLLSKAERDAHDLWLAGRVTTLLGHFYEPDHDPSVFAMMVVDWVDALGGYSQDVVTRACRSYLVESNRRPTIADIAERCHALTPRPTVVKAPPKPAKPKAPRVTPEQRAKMVDEAGIKSPVLRKVLRGEGIGE